MGFHSLWAATTQDAPDFQPLSESVQTDVLVIGGGFQGLSTALHLAEAGTDTVLLEAETPGAGASGRNGGQVIPGLKDDPDALDRLWGPQATEFAGATADMLFSLVDRLGLDCEASRGGWIQAGSKQVHLAGLRHRMEQWAARGVPVKWLDAEAMAHETGSFAFSGGWIDPRAGKIHPLKFAYGLAQAARMAGAQIHSHSRVISLIQNASRWKATLESGATVQAGRVLLATNVYTPASLNRNLKRATVPANSFQLATRPLDSKQLSRILPNGAVVSEARRVGTYFRIGPGNRLMIGGRGTFTDPRQPADFRQIEKELTTLFGPGFDIEYRWFGRVGMTTDHRIRLCAPAPGLMMATGFNGRGVALATALGKVLAEHMTSGTDLPVPVEPEIRTLPFHALHPIYGGLAIRYYQLRDSFDR